MNTNHAVIAVIGLDQPGIVACVSAVLTQLNCNIEEMTQTSLLDQFAGIYVIKKPEEVSNQQLEEALTQATQAKKLRLTVIARDFEALQSDKKESEPFVISVYGKDRNDIVGTFAHMFGAQGINIDSLRAFPIGDGSSMQVFEVSIPVDIDTRSLHRVLLDKAKKLELHLTMQHRAIFEAVHRIAVV